MNGEVVSSTSNIDQFVISNIDLHWFTLKREDSTENSGDDYY